MLKFSFIIWHLSDSLGLWQLTTICTLKWFLEFVILDWISDVLVEFWVCLLMWCWLRESIFCRGICVYPVLMSSAGFVFGNKLSSLIKGSSKNCTSKCCDDKNWLIKSLGFSKSVYNPIIRFLKHLFLD